MDVVSLFMLKNINGEGKWDNDYKNSMNVGDNLGFITGDKDTAIITFYKFVRGYEPNLRHEHWKKLVPYTEGNGKLSVGHRNPIILVPTGKSQSWSSFRTVVGYSPIYFPRGTSRIVKSHLIQN